MTVVIGIAFAAMGAYVSNRQSAPQAPENKAVAQFLAQQLKDSEGKTQLLSQWQGKMLIVNFWATWCAPCVKEMPELSALQIEYKGKPVQILGMGIDSPSNIEEFARKYQISYPLFAAGMEGSELSRQLGNNAGGLPFTILIAPDGKVLKNYLGRLKMEELRTDIAKFSLEK